MISIQSIKFDTSDWQLLEESHDELFWQNDRDAALVTLHYFSKPPDIPCPLDEIDLLRHCYRQGVAAAGGGIVSVEVFDLKKLDCVEILCKIPQEPHGMTYVASLTFPFSQFSYVIKIQAEEFGMTGLRDSIVMSDFMRAGQVEIDTQSNTVHGWNEDPYDPSYEGPNLRNKSDDERYDEKFPEHPLSRARRILKSIKQTFIAADDLFAAKKFTG